MVGTREGARDRLRSPQGSGLIALWLVAMALVAAGVFGDAAHVVDHGIAFDLALAGGALGAIWCAFELRRVIERRR